MVDIAISVLATIAEYSLAPIVRQFGYLFCYNRNIEKMRSQSEKLEAKRHRVQQEVDAAHRNCEIVEDDVEAWLIRVNEKKIEADAILENRENVGSRCLNLKSCYWLSKKATKRTQDLVALLVEGQFQRVSYPPPPLGIVPTLMDDKESTQLVVEVQGDGKSEATSSAAPAPVADVRIASTSTSSNGEFESRLSIMRDIMEAVKDNKVRMIGIWGMGGVGKTTMVKQIAKRAREECMFHEVVMAVVTQEPDLRKIQGDIAELLGRKLEEQSLLARAARLHERLNDNGKRILVILDDVWKRLDLEEVGIPSGDFDHNGCKIVLTSRNRDVFDQMKANKIFRIEVLSDKEAWILFRNTTDNLLYATDLHHIAKDIVKECRGLPIAITTIARTLANKSEATWNDVLRQLKNSMLEGEYAVVFNILKVSYDFLETKEIKDFFLLCCLFPDDFDISIEDLIRYGVGLRLFKKIDKLREARNRAHAHVEKLTNSNLLLGSEIKDCVKMHDLVRDFSLSIATKDDHVFMVRFGNGLKEWPIEDTYEHFTSISLQCDQMRELPNGLKCSNLKLLLLKNFSKIWGRSHSMTYPEAFYEGMGELQVLDSRSMSIPSLPGSFQLLNNLRTLSLFKCTVKDDISIIGSLVKLEILSFVWSDIKELPREIGKLSQLRLLDLTGCRELQIVAPGVLSSLIRLEDLYMRYTSFSWAEQIKENLAINNDIPLVHETNASFAELKQLSNLVCIDTDIPYEALPVDLIVENLEKFMICIGGKMESESLYAFQNTLDIRVDTSVLVEGVMKALCRRTEILYLKVKDLKNLVSESGREGFLKLKILKLESCNELVSVVNAVGRDTTSVFPILESLYLFDLSNLEDICRGQHSKQRFHIPSSVHQLAPFGNLRVLSLRGCNKLKNIFSPFIARGLVMLERLTIRDCQMMEAIFCSERGEDEKGVVFKIEFLKLEHLCFEDLPNLVSFCKSVDSVELPRMEHLELRNLPKLASLFSEMKTLDSEHHHGSPNHSFFNQKVTLTKMAKLILLGMDNLMTVFPTNVIEQLQNLEFLDIEECSSVEVVLDLQGLNIKEGHEPVALSRLRDIYLSGLPKLTHLWKTGPNIIQGFQNVRWIVVTRCDSLRHLFTPSMAKILVGLEDLEISDCMLLEAIVAEEEGGEEECTLEGGILFPQLTRILLVGLPNLSTIMPWAYTLNWSSLDWNVIH